MRYFVCACMELLIGFVTVSVATGDGGRCAVAIETLKFSLHLPHRSSSRGATPYKKPEAIASGFLYGAANRIRTDDLVITNDVLYRLSYSSIERTLCGDV